MIADSRATAPREATGYVTSEPQDDYWGQPSAGCHILVVVGGSMYGNIVQCACGSTVSPDILEFDPELVAEFEAWESASDEALADFESALD